MNYWQSRRKKKFARKKMPKKKVKKHLEVMRFLMKGVRLKKDDQEKRDETS